MSAPARGTPGRTSAPPVTPIPSESIARVTLSDVVESPFQPRTVMDEAELASLAESIRVHGLLSPPTVRPVGGKGWLAAEGTWDYDQLELVVGHRRTAAARRLGLTEMTVVIRPLDDLAVQLAQDVENVQRVGIPVADRVAHLVRLRDVHAMTAEQIAAKTSTPVSTVRELLALVRMPVILRDAVNAGRVPVATAAIVCRIPGEEGRRAASLAVLLGSPNVASVAKLNEKQIADQLQRPGSAMSKAEALHLIQTQFQRELKSAPFPRKASEAKRIGLETFRVPFLEKPCETCTDRAGVRAKIDPDYAGTRADTCLNVACYAERSDLWIQAETHRLANEGKRIGDPDELAHVAHDGKLYVRYDVTDFDDEPRYELKNKCGWPLDTKKTTAQLIGDLPKSLVVHYTPLNGHMARLVKTAELIKALQKGGQIKPKEAAAKPGMPEDGASKWAKRTRAIELVAKACRDDETPPINLVLKELVRSAALMGMSDAIHAAFHIEDGAEAAKAWLMSASIGDHIKLGSALLCADAIGGADGILIDSLSGRTADQWLDAAEAELKAEAKPGMAKPGRKGRAA